MYMWIFRESAYTVNMPARSTNERIVCQVDSGSRLNDGPWLRFSSSDSAFLSIVLIVVRVDLRTGGGRS